MEDIERRNNSKKRAKHPKRKANVFQRLFFWWQIPIIIEGWRKDITENDLYATLEEHKAQKLGDLLEETWLLDNCDNKKSSLWRVLIKTFGWECMQMTLLYLPVDIICLISQPLILTKILNYFQNQSDSDKVYLYASSMVLIFLIQALVFNHVTIKMYSLGLKIRSACSSLIYRYILKLDKTKLQQLSTGHLINLMSNDVGKFDEAFVWLQTTIAAPVEVILTSIYLYMQLGVAALFGIAVLIICLGINLFISKKAFYCRLEVAENTDRRLSLLNDVISGVRTVKMYTWEQSFEKMIQETRSLEVKAVRKANYYNLGVNSLRIYFTPVCVFLGVLGLLFSNHEVTPQYFYSLKNIYENLMITVVLSTPFNLMRLSSADASVKRIQDFLITVDSFYEFKVSAVKYSGTMTQNLYGIHLQGVSAKWNQESDKIVEGVSFSAFPGDLIGVIGTSGSGKTSLLHIVLKELVTDGFVSVTGTISYASQEAWIFSSSIRQNIVFDQTFDLEKYSKVVQICALEHDFNLFPDRDSTLVGERGIMLSGGQKARINLARAIYKDADIYLLDDPLSAVDVQVAKHIYNECFVKYLKGKCVVLTTHQVHFLNNVTKLYLIEKGKIRTIEKLETGKHVNWDMVGNDLGVAETGYRVLDEDKEYRTRGNKSIKSYKFFCLSVGHWCLTFGIIFAFFFSQLFKNCFDYFLNFWIDVNVGNISWPKFFTSKDFLFLYGSLLLCLTAIVIATNLLFVKYCGKTSRNLHQKILTRVLSATMTFFNHNSSGRILNRFSKDIGAIDESLPLLLSYGITEFFVAMGSLVIVSSINYWMTIPTLVLVVLLFLCVYIFQPANKDLKRTEGITRSFVYSHLNETLQGLTTIRALEAGKTLSREFDQHLDLNVTASYLLNAVYCVLAFWTDCICVVYMTFVTFGFLILPQDLYLGSVGLALSETMALLAVFEYLIKLWGEIETEMTSVERVAEYTQIPLETDDGACFVSDKWPTKGKISFEKVSLKYSPDQSPVLKQVSFEVSAGQKIGIVGRTGAGKTSIISALFRLFQFDGTIRIDNIDTKTIPLKSLRSKISVIPQDPVLFLGSLRKNLDPFSEFDDQQIWKILEELDLKKTISSLDSQVSEGGSNFSVGQKQLLCLVRAVLQNRKIIVLDEATANVDLETDQIIQKAIKKLFAECTVLTIAHRLNTIIDSDRVLVMDDGCAVEFDSPKSLLQNKDSVFYGFVKECGEEFLESLKSLMEC